MVTVHALFAGEIIAVAHYATNVIPPVRLVLSMALRPRDCVVSVCDERL